MRVLDLFCGTKSVAKVAAERGHFVTTIDIDPQFSPTIVADVRDLAKLDLVPGFYDMVWASPPCEKFSVCRIGTNWNKDNRPKTVGAVEALEVVACMRSIIERLAPKVFFIENPRGKLRKLPVMDGLRRDTVTYCQYGLDRQKPTDIWHNCDLWVPRPECAQGASCHQSAPRGSKTGTQGLKNAIERGVVPRQLVEEILDAAQRTCEEEPSR